MPHASQVTGRKSDQVALGNTNNFETIVQANLEDFQIKRARLHNDFHVKQ